MTNPNLGGREVTNDSRLREVALIIADDLIGICETATKVAHRTGNTFVIDRQRTASMIQGRIASLNKSNPNEHQPHAGSETLARADYWYTAGLEANSKGDQTSAVRLIAQAYFTLLNRMTADAETRPSESGECQPPAVFSDPPTPLLRCEPAAWQYDLATVKSTDGVYEGWTRKLTTYAPHVPQDSIRNIKPLYASPIQGAGVSEAEIIERCAKVAEDERQHSNHAHQRGDQAKYAETGFEIACDQIASAIRSLTTPPASTDGAVGSVKP